MALFRIYFVIICIHVNIHCIWTHVDGSDVDGGGGEGVVESGLVPP